MAALAADLIRLLPRPSALAGPDDVVIAANQAATNIFPMLKEGAPLAIAIRQPDFVSALRGVRRGAGPVRVTIADLVPVARTIEIRVAPAGDDLVLVTLEDLSAIEKLDRMRADFVANASHELRTPLASVLGFIETIRGPARDDLKARENFLGIMEDQARRMARLIDDLLSLSRVELNAHGPPSDKLDLVALVRQVMDGIQPMAARRNVEVSLLAAPETAPIIADRDEMLRVFDNLIDNAVKYGFSGHKVEVKVEPSGESMWRAEVRDYGPGIPPEHLPRLTERFY
ncbi:MAG: histidine kinase dimerization/phospho-acceptor domain-containing protein, partial [Bosea sp. (in: a-proteobacteria)]